MTNSVVCSISMNGIGRAEFMNSKFQHPIPITTTTKFLTFFFAFPSQFHKFLNFKVSASGHGHGHGEGDTTTFTPFDFDLPTRLLCLSRNNKPTTALQLFWSMDHTLLQPHLPLHLHACNSLLACLSRNSMLHHMITVFAIMRRHTILSPHSFTLLFKAIAKFHGTHKALLLFHQWQQYYNYYFDVIVYNTLLSICAKDNDWLQLERIWEAMKFNGVLATQLTYRILVCTFVRCGQYEIATHAYAEMLNNQIPPAYDAMHAVISAYSKENNFHLAFTVFQTMLRHGFNPNLIACNALINSLAKAAKLKQAFQVYNHIKLLGHTPDSYTWNALLTAFYRANHYADALHFFHTIHKHPGFQPNEQLYNTALMCCQRLGFWDKALQFLWKMEKSGISVSTATYNIVIGACEVGRKPKVAFQVFEHMLHQNCAPDTFTRLSLIRSCIWGDLWDEVEEILDESTPNVSLYNAAIHGMCLRGKIESGKRLYIRMRDIGLVPDGKTRALMLQYMRKKSTSRRLK